MSRIWIFFFQVNVDQNCHKTLSQESQKILTLFKIKILINRQLDIILDCIILNTILF